ncbi:MAG TPA: response regulator [Chloroflexota bacterium]|nr:response regulator [Chloroflexota bacterium]
MSKRVLIVEDEQDVATLISGVLDLEGYETRLAVGETAMESALEFRPDVVLLDLMMPVVDGFQVARLLHGERQTADIPIIVMTAMHDAAARGAELGAAHVLAKPFDIDDMLHQIDQATA